MFSDINLSQTIFKKVPATWHPYIKLARLDRPAGIGLLLIPCLWAIVLASHGLLRVPPLTLLLFAVGAVLMRSAGCIINDLWDKDFDANVARTKDRPLASGEIGAGHALRFLVVLLGLSLLVLIQLPHMAIVLGVLSLVLVVSYPYMKRLTWVPQLFLGFTFNWGALMGWAAVAENIALPPILLYIGGIFWTLAYDTIYAHQDVEDDARVGIKSTAQLFGENSKFYVSIFYALSLICLFAAKASSDHASFLTPLMSALPGAYAVWQIRAWDKNDPISCRTAFKRSQGYGLLALLMLAV